jgi:hypothetical protein
MNILNVTGGYCCKVIELFNCKQMKIAACLDAVCLFAENFTADPAQFLSGLIMMRTQTGPGLFP